MELANSELKPLYEEKYFKDSDLFTLMDIDNVNHKPHVFMIGPRHITYASDHHGGMLGKETLNKIHCAMPHCNLMYDDHTSDTVMFLQLKKEASSEEVQNFLKTLIDDWKEHGIDGCTFVETPEKFRII